MFIIELTEEEIRAQLQLNHRALLHSGAEVADAAVHLKNKYMAALQKLQQVEKPNGKAAERSAAVGD